MESLLENKPCFLEKLSYMYTLDMIQNPMNPFMSMPLHQKWTILLTLPCLFHVVSML